ncbi:MAG: type II toxin-antitoxin system VapC family toxin [Xanthobacteraceae bacterium]
MIILDTNVLSELMKLTPDPSVARWLDGHAPESVWTTAVSVYELRVGIERMAPGRRRRDLEGQFERVIFEDLRERVLAFDRPAAYNAAALEAKRRTAGRPVEVRDTMIAGIVTSRRAEFATGNVRHFADLGVRVIDPWST